jgi:predicted metal-dependent HD superfamily phosphohydrolase
VGAGQAAGQELAGWVESLPAAWTAGCGAEVFSRARASYSSPGRAYHTWDHILDCTQKLRDFECASPRAAFLALLFHDAIYVPGRSDNESRSGMFAADVLNSSSARLEMGEIGAIGRMILATRDHRLPADRRDPDVAVVLDIDMSILGAPWERYRQYADGVRAEYVPAAAGAARFTAGRTAFLSRLLAGGPIFHTAQGLERWERPARENIAREIEALRNAGGLLSRLLSALAKLR